jgi:pilus assembly protein Flp/PilA
MKEIIRWIADEESGQGMVEYSLIIVLIAISLIFSLKAFGEKLQNSFVESSNKIQ